MGPGEYRGRSGEVRRIPSRVKHVWALTGTGAVAALMPGKEFLGRLRDGIWDRAAFYEVPPMVDNLPPGTTIANIDAHTKTFALAGRGLTNRVVGPARFGAMIRQGATLKDILEKEPADFLFVFEEKPAGWLDGADVQIVYDGCVLDGRVGPKPVRIYSTQRAADGRSPNLAQQPDQLTPEPADRRRLQ